MRDRMQHDDETNANKTRGRMFGNGGRSARVARLGKCGPWDSKEKMKLIIGTTRHAGLVKK